MKQVVNVSIAGVSFTLENDAHTILEQYLDELRECYKDEQTPQEIMEDIEERIAELLLERGIRERVVSYREVSDIIDILGHPGDIKREDPEGASSDGDKKPVKKKLFRDLSNKVIGGVCSGLAAYSGTDPVLVRLIFVLAALISSIIRTFGIFNIGYGEVDSFEIMILFYLLMWIIVPAARTVEQKCAMYGYGAGIDDMHKNMKAAPVNMRAGQSGTNEVVRDVFNVVTICLGAGMLLAGFAGLVLGMFLFVGIELFEGVSLLSVMDYVELGVENTLLVKILFALSYTIPFIAMLYLGCRLCFKFKAPSWRPGVIMTIVWIASFFALVVLGVKSVTPYFDNTNWSDDRALSGNIDTLYINMEPFDGIEKSATIKKGVSIMGSKIDYVLKRDGGGVEFIDYPSVRIVKHAADENGLPYKGFIECKYVTYDNLGLYQKNNSVDLDSILRVDDSLVTILPNIYSKESKMKGESFVIWIHVPDTVEVIKRDEFGKSITYNE
ncbi:MAG: PspC domain-containing protein [Bacteroidales bacterium]|nr:PspC domain-containing protein [Bacteroidales bacterium]